MTLLEPGLLAIGAEDVEKVELTFWLKDVGHAQLVLGFRDGPAETEEDKTAASRREWLFDLFRDEMLAQAAKGTLEMTYDPDELASA
jgi:hypothetical protein